MANNWVDVSHLLSNLLTRQKMIAIKSALSDWSTLDIAEKRLRARTLLQQEIPDISASITSDGIQNSGSRNMDVDILMNSNESSSNENESKISEKLPVDVLMHDQPRSHLSSEPRLPDVASRKTHSPVITTTAPSTITTRTISHATNSATIRYTTRRVFPLQKGFRLINFWFTSHEMWTALPSYLI